MRKLSILYSILAIHLMAFPAFSSQLKVYVAEMNAVGAANKDEMRATLQTLLASRLNNDQIMSVGTPAEADIIVSGTYVTIGKIFSIDALAKSGAGKTLARSFVQGESQDELIPSIGKLADKLSVELVRLYIGAAPSSSTVILPTAQTGIAAPSKTDFIRPEKPVPQVQQSDFIKPRETERSANSGWLSKRLDGIANLIATGVENADGTRELFLAEDRKVSLYRQAADMKLVSSFELKPSEKIISIDTLESTAGTELYVTIIRNDDVNSQVWRVQDNKLIKLAENIPYFFRATEIAASPRRLLVQSMGRDADFYGDVYEAVRNGSTISTKTAIKMPRYGNIYSFNQFRDTSGTVYTVVINPDNYLIVYGADQSELWRSSEKFGGSALYYQKEDLDNARTTGDKFRWIFLNQRIQTTSKGDIITGKNDGFFVMGNARSYKKGSVYCLAWNGSSLEEKWHTRESQNYMPDFQLDEKRNELMILQTVQRSMNGQGASSLMIKKVE